MGDTTPGRGQPGPRDAMLSSTTPQVVAHNHKRGLSLSARLPPWASKARSLAAPVLVAFLAFIFVAVPALNRLAGEYAFLCYTSVILFFFPRGRVSQQIENNTTNFLGATAGLGWSSAVVAVAGWCGQQYGRDAPQARAVLGTGLAVLSLVCGTLRSYAPRLNVACRAAMFYPIFVLTMQQTTTGFTLAVFLNPFLVAVFAYGFSTIVGVALSEHSSSPQLGAQILKSVQSTCDLLPMSLMTILDTDEALEPAAPSSMYTSFGGDSTVHTFVAASDRALEEQQQSEPSTWSKQQKLARTLRNEVAAIRNTHSAYTLDIVWARQDPQSLLPVVRLLGRLQRNAILGPTGHVPGERIRTALQRAYATPSLSSRHTSMSGTPLRSRSRERGRSRPSSRPGSMLSVHEHLSATQLATQLSKVATHSRDQTGGRRRHPSPGPAATPSPARVRLTETCKVLSNAIISALNFAAGDIAVSCDWLDPPEDGTENGEKAREDSATAANKLKAQIRAALNDLERRLSGIIDAGDFSGATPDNLATPTPSSPVAPATPVTPRTVVFEDQMTSSDWLDDEDRFRIAFYMIALLDLAKDATALLEYAVKLRTDSAGTPKRWIFPSIVWPWTRVTPESPILPTIPGESPPGQQEDEPDDNLDDLDFVRSVLRKEARPRPHGRDVRARATAAWRSVWDRREVVFGRVAISQALHQLKHSRHVHFALKQTVGISLLSLPAFLALGDDGRSWYDASRGPWMVVSFMYVIEVTTGATLRIGFYRMLGTFIGAVVGYICVLIAGENPYGLVALSTACAVPISYCMLFTSVAPLGVITGITLSPVVFIEYLNLGGGQSAFRLAWERFVDITIGIAAAVVVGTWLWPIHARVQYFRAVADTMDQITEYYLRMSRDLLRPELVYRANSKQYRAVEIAVRRQITRSRNLVDIQRQEISLLPRPIKLYSEVIDLMERLLETFTEVRTLRFSLPRKATVLDVLPIRRELVSAILVNLWATAQAFRSRSPLPQLLPSPREPLSEVMETTDEHAHAVRSRRAKANLRRRWPRHEDYDSDDSATVAGAEGIHHAELSVLYGMAENEALGEAINSIDEILAAARTLFGTQAFLDVNVNM